MPGQKSLELEDAIKNGVQSRIDGFEVRSDILFFRRSKVFPKPDDKNGGQEKKIEIAAADQSKPGRLETFLQRLFSIALSDVIGYIMGAAQEFQGVIGQKKRAAAFEQPADFLQNIDVVGNALVGDHVEKRNEIEAFIFIRQPPDIGPGQFFEAPEAAEIKGVFGVIAAKSRPESLEEFEVIAGAAARIKQPELWILFEPRQEDVPEDLAASAEPPEIFLKLEMLSVFDFFHFC